MRYLHGLPVIFDNICVIHSPRLHDIATEGLDKFYQYISATQISKPTKLEDPEVKQLLSPLSDFEYLLLLTQMDKEDNKLIKDAFEFFTKEKITILTNPPSIVFGPINEKRILTKEKFSNFQEEIKLACAMRDLILWWASYLYAFSTYPLGTQLLGVYPWQDNPYTGGSLFPVLSY